MINNSITLLLRDKWTVCITDYVQEVRRRAACIGYALGNDEEQVFERMFAVGEGVDSGRISCEDGLAEMRKARYVPAPTDASVKCE